MPSNPQTKTQSSLAQQFLAKIVKQEEVNQYQEDSIAQNHNNDIAQGKWEDQQNLKFVIFIDFYSKIFSSKQRRKSEKIFKILSKFLGNRTAAQCRSHYQKVMIKFKTIAKLKRFYKQYFGEENYVQNYKEFTSNWKEIGNEEPTIKIQEKKQLMETGIQTDSIFSYDGQMEFMNQMYQQMQWFNPFYLQSFQNWNQQA